MDKDEYVFALKHINKEHKKKAKKINKNIYKLPKLTIVKIIFNEVKWNKKLK
ncbi:hypothetical protein HYS31_05555 [Candidatus Woesearchaeota archaeon]|nr:hypothetical protein [Candidatus Woesearchaeota archaeon]